MRGHSSLSAASAAPPNGSGAAAILAAGIGSLALAFLAIAGDRFPAFAKSMIFFRPTGPLSGVSTVAIAVWLFAWIVLELLWRGKDLRMGRISAAACILLLLALLLTFPPLADLF